MSNATTTNYDVETETLGFLKAKHIFETTGIGSKANEQAERKMERIVAYAERTGNLNALLAALGYR